MGWVATIEAKHLFTKEEDHVSVQASMSQIADVLESSEYFRGFDTSKFRAIPKGDGNFRPIDYANRLLNEMYDYADEHRIWIS